MGKDMDIADAVVQAMRDRNKPAIRQFVKWDYSVDPPRIVHFNDHREMNEIVVEELISHNYVFQTAAIVFSGVCAVYTAYNWNELTDYISSLF